MSLFSHEDIFPQEFKFLLVMVLELTVSEFKQIVCYKASSNLMWIEVP